MTVSRNRPSPELTAQNPPKKCMAACRRRSVSPGRGAVFPFLHMFYCPSSVLHTHQRVNPCQFSWFHWILKDSSKPKWGVPDCFIWWCFPFPVESVELGRNPRKEPYKLLVEDAVWDALQPLACALLSQGHYAHSTDDETRMPWGSITHVVWQGYSDCPNWESHRHFQEMREGEF